MAATRTRERADAARQRSAQEDDRHGRRAHEQARFAAAAKRDVHGSAAEDDERGLGREGDGGARRAHGSVGDEHSHLRRREEAGGEDRGAREGIRGALEKDRRAAEEGSRGAIADADALNQAVVRSADPSSGTPSTYATRFCGSAGTRRPGVSTPTRFSGSQALRLTRSSPTLGSFRTARTASTASGSANCSPEKACANRPPRISPRASIRR